MSSAAFLFGAMTCAICVTGFVILTIKHRSEAVSVVFMVGALLFGTFCGTLVNKATTQAEIERVANLNQNR